MKKIICLMLALMLMTSFIPNAFASALEESVSIILDKQNIQNGMELIENPPNHMFTQDTSAYYSVIEGIGCKTIGSTLHNVDSYAYFRVDDERIYDTNQNLYMLVEYYDSEPYEFWIEYDGVSGAYTKSDSVMTVGNKKWKQVVISLPNAKFANSLHFDSDFRLAIRYGNQKHLSVKQIEIVKDIAECKSYNPYIEISSNVAYGGIKSNCKNLNFENRDAIIINDSADFDVDDRIGAGTKNSMAVIEYFDNGSVFNVSYKKNGEWVTTENFGGSNTGRYTKCVASLSGLELSGGAEDIKVTKMSGEKPIYVSSFILEKYDESLKAQYGTAILDKNGEQFMTVSTEAQKEVSGEYVSFASASESFELSFDIDEAYMGAVESDIYIELEYKDGADKSLQASYTGVDSKALTTGEYMLSENLTSAFLVLEKAVLCNGMDNGADFKLKINAPLLDIKALRVHKTMPLAESNYYDSYKDVGGASSQGVHSWRFVSYESASDSFKDLQRDGTMWKRNGGLPFIYTSGTEFMIDVGTGGGLSWTAPESGEIVIYSQPHMLRYEPSSDGVKAVILKNKEICSETVIASTDVTGTKKIIQLSVTKGDTIYFKGDPNGSTNCDFLCWAPKVVLTPSVEISEAKESKEAKIKLSKKPESTGIMINHDESSVILGSSSVTLIKNYQDIPKIAFKFTEDYRYADSEINPVYVEALIADSYGRGLWCEYYDVNGNLKKTNVIATTQTGQSKKIAFCLKDADFKAEDAYHFAICAEQVEGAVIYEVKTSQTIPDSYVLNFSAQNAENEGLSLRLKDSKGVMNNGYTVLDKKVIELSGDSPFAVMDVENTYAYLNNKNTMYMMIEYFDNLSEFYIEYTDADGNVAKSETVTCKNSLSWQNAVIILPQMSFTSSFDGGDFKICATNKDKLSIHSISASKQLFSDYYIGSNSGNSGEPTGVKMLSKTQEFNEKNAVMLSKTGDMVQFDIDDTVFYGLPADNKVYNITVSYFDCDDATFKVTYDAPALKIFSEHNAESWQIVTTGSKTWKTANLPVSRAWFKNGQVNGADFSVVKVDGNDDLWISGATVREGFGEMYDVATEDCIVKASTMYYNADLRENPSVSPQMRYFGTTYDKTSDQRAFDGTNNIPTTEDGYDWYEIAFPTLTPTRICGIALADGWDRQFKIEYKRADNGEWETIVEGKFIGNSSASSYIVTFKPVEASAIRASGVCDTWAGGSYKTVVFSDVPNKRDYHQGTLDITTEKDVFNGEDAVFTINYTSEDADSGEYTAKGYIMDLKRETVKDNLINETVPANGAKTLSFTLPASDSIFKEGRAYYFITEIYKDNLLMARDMKLFGRAGVSQRENIPPLQPIWNKTRNLSTIGQFNHATAYQIPTSVFETLGGDLGYDTIQIEFYWNEIEPLPGVYDFTNVDAAVQKAMEQGLTVSLWLEFQDELNPEWIGQEHAQKDQYGQNMYPRMSMYTGYYADALWPSLWSDVFIEHTTKAWREMIKRYNGYSSVSSYGLGGVDCEVNIVDDGYRYYDYSEYSQKAYREEYLQKYLGLNLQQVGERYGRTYNSWDEVRLQVPEKDAKGDFSGQAWADFLDFRGWSTMEHAKRFMKILDEEAPGRQMFGFIAPVGYYDEEIFNLTAKSGSQGTMAAANEYARIVQSLSFIGNGLGFLVHGEPGYIPATSREVGNVGRTIFNTVMAGEATINWQGPLYQGRERVVIHGYDRQIRYQANEQIKDFMRIGEELMKTDSTDNEMAYVMGTYLNGVPTWERHGYYAYNNDIITLDVHGAIQAFVEYGDTHRGVDYYTDYNNGAYTTPDRLAQYKLIIDRNDGANHDNVINNLVEYVRNGGKLLLFSDSCKTNLTQSEQWPLLKKLGAKQLPNEEMTMEGKWITVNNSPVFNDGTKVWIQNWRDISDWGDWAQPVIVDENGKKMMVKWNFGSGEVLYCSGEISEGVSGMDAHSFLNGVCDYAGVGIQCESETTSGYTWTVRKDVKKYGTDRFMMVFPENHSGDATITVANNALADNVNYNVYLAHRDYDEYLQTVKKGDWLGSGFTLPSLQLGVLKYTTDRLTSAMGAFNGQDAETWTYYSDGKEITNVDYKAKVATDGTVRFTEQNVNPVKKAERRWTAPESGVITIKGDVELVNKEGKVSAKILHNGEVIESLEVGSETKKKTFNVAIDVKEGDTIGFVAENLGDAALCEIIWNPHIALAKKSTKISFENSNGLSGDANDKTWTATEDGKVIIQGTVKTEEGNSAAGYILRGIHGKFGHMITSEMGDYPYFIEIYVSKGDVLHFKTERSENGEALKWTGDIWYIK